MLQVLRQSARRDRLAAAGRDVARAAVIGSAVIRNTGCSAGAHQLESALRKTGTEIRM